MRLEGAESGKIVPLRLTGENPDGIADVIRILGAQRSQEKLSVREYWSRTCERHWIIRVLLMMPLTRLLIGANVAVLALEAVSGSGFLAAFALWPLGHFVVPQFVRSDLTCGS
jgi:hypothetical protein